jgi:anthranilate phosphoribosyltransferase
MKVFIRKLMDYAELSPDEAAEAVHLMAKGDQEPAQVAAFLTCYMMRPVTVQELSGFRSALLDLALPAGLENREVIDLCGTGGDGKDTFNISTLASFVVAGAGYPVAKHGNYGVSSVCGSSNVMEFLGYRFGNAPDQLKRELDGAGITFLHAPLFHPAMKAVAPVRRALGLKTFFNQLGPLVNPARPPKQFTGVFNLELARTYHHILQASGMGYTVVHSLDGYDEVSLTGPFRMYSHRGEGLLAPKDLGLPQCEPSQLFGGATIAEAAQIFQSVLAGQGTAAQMDAVVANASLAIYTASEKPLAECRSIAEDSLYNQKAQQSFSQLLSLNSPL